MGIKKLWNKTKEIKGEADAGKQKQKQDKDIEKKKKSLENKRDKEISQLKSIEAHQMSIKSKEYRAYVVINLINGTLTEEIAVLGAEIGYKNEQPVLRVKDKDEKIIFEEPKPDAIDEFNYVDEETIDKKLKDCKNALKKLQSGEKKAVDGLYESDWLELFRSWSARKTHAILGEKGSYMKIRNGSPHYEFDLIGYFKIPLFRYTSKSMISIPPLDKIVTGQVLMKKISDEINAEGRDAQKLMNTIFGMLIAVTLLGSLFLMYKSGQTDVEVSENFNEAVKNVASLVNQSNELNAIRAGIEDLNKNLVVNISDSGPTKDLGIVLK